MESADGTSLSRPRSEVKLTVKETLVTIFREGWLGILLLAFGVVQATFSIKAFLSTGYPLLTLLSLAKSRDRILNLTLFSAGALPLFLYGTCIVAPPKSVIEIVGVLVLSLASLLCAGYRVRKLTGL